MDSFERQRRNQLVLLITSRWDEYKLNAEACGVDVEEKWHTYPERNSNPRKKAEHRLREDNAQLQSWIGNPPDLDTILPKLHESNAAYRILLKLLHV